MENKKNRINISCPLCNHSEYVHWAKDNGYDAVKCVNCGLVYVNPRPVDSLIDEAVQTGVHSERDGDRDSIVRREGYKVSWYEKIIKEMYEDVWSKKVKISWIDIGAGYGEFIEAVGRLASSDSEILGVEPMKPKVQDAIKRGLNMKECYLSDIHEKYEFASLINVFSHIPDFHEFLENLKKILTPNGEFFLETGNIGDLKSRKEVPSELDLPDHLVFAGEKNIIRYLEEAGFEIVSVKGKRKDTFFNFLKLIIKKLIGRNVTLAIPYTSKYRTLFIRTRLK